MASPVIILVNQTVSDITLEQLAIVVPGSGSIDVSQFNYSYEISNDTELQALVDSGDINITYNGETLTTEQSKEQLSPLPVNLKNNLSATSNPASTDDSVAGYSVGSVWLNLNTQVKFVCFDSTASSAVWVSNQGGGGGGGAQLIFGADSVSTSVTPRFLFPSYINSLAQTNPVPFPVSRAGTIKNMFLNQVGDGNGLVISYILRVNGAQTSLSISVPTTANSGSNTSDSVAVNQGDLIDIEVTKPDRIGSSPNEITVGIEFE